MNAALAHADHDDSRFVGQILMRSSPVLTWRPTVLEKIENDNERRSVLDVAGLQRIPMESSVRLSGRGPRASSSPTKRMPAWPLVAKLVHHTRSDGAARFAVRVGSALFAGGVLGLLVLFAVAPLIVRSPHAAAMSAALARATSSASSAPALPTTSKAPSVHVMGDPIDTMATVASIDDEDAADADDAMILAAPAKHTTHTTASKPHAKPKRGGPHGKAKPHPQPHHPAKPHHA